MKGFINAILLFICLFTFIPFVILIFEHLISGRDSILQKMLDSMID